MHHSSHAQDGTGTNTAKISCSRGCLESVADLRVGPFHNALRNLCYQCAYPHKAISSMHRYAETNKNSTDNQEELKFVKPCDRLSSSRIQVVRETCSM